MDKYDREGREITKILYGDRGLNDRTIGLSYIPCIPKQLTDKNKHLVDKECIADLKDPKALEKKF
jgi:hypothetical protein